MNLEISNQQAPDVAVESSHIRSELSRNKSKKDVLYKENLRDSVADEDKSSYHRPQRVIQKHDSIRFLRNCFQLRHQEYKNSVCKAQIEAPSPTIAEHTSIDKSDLEVVKAHKKIFPRGIRRSSSVIIEDPSIEAFGSPRKGFRLGIRRLSTTSVEESSSEDVGDSPKKVFHDLVVNSSFPCILNSSPERIKSPKRLFQRGIRRSASIDCTRSGYFVVENTKSGQVVGGSIATDISLPPLLSDKKKIKKGIKPRNVNPDKSMKARHNSHSSGSRSKHDSAITVKNLGRVDFDSVNSFDKKSLDDIFNIYKEIVDLEGGDNSTGW